MFLWLALDEWRSDSAHRLTVNRPWAGCRSRSSGRSVPLCRLCSSSAEQPEASRPGPADALLTHTETTVHLRANCAKPLDLFLLGRVVPSFASPQKSARLTATDVDLVQGVFWRGEHPHVWSELLGQRLDDVLRCRCAGDSDALGGEVAGDPVLEVEPHHAMELQVLGRDREFIKL